MKVFITLFLVWLFTIAPFASEQNVVKLPDNKKGDVYACSCGTNLLQISDSVFYEQDSDDFEGSGTYYMQVTPELNPVVQKFQYNQNLYLTFYQICFSNLLIDLPPPQSLFI